jgi:hypothetical protein
VRIERFTSLPPWSIALQVTTVAAGDRFGGPRSQHVNPLVDTRARVRRFLRDLLGKVSYLSGSVATLQPVWKDCGVVSAHETGDVDTHSADVRVFDPAGVWVSTQHVGVDLTPANLALDVVTALDSGA